MSKTSERDHVPSQMVSILFITFGLHLRTIYLPHIILVPANSHLIILKIDRPHSFPRGLKLFISPTFPFSDKEMSTKNIRKYFFPFLNLSKLHLSSQILASLKYQKKMSHLSNTIQKILDALNEIGSLEIPATETLLL